MANGRAAARLELNGHLGQPREVEPRGPSWAPTRLWCGLSTKRRSLQCSEQRNDRNRLERNRSKGTDKHYFPLGGGYLKLSPQAEDPRSSQPLTAGPRCNALRARAQSPRASSQRDLLTSQSLGTLLPESLPSLTFYDAHAQASRPDFYLLG